jgi:hypothetical protein
MHITVYNDSRFSPEPPSFDVRTSGFVPARFASGKKEIFCRAKRFEGAGVTHLSPVHWAGSVWGRLLIQPPDMRPRSSSMPAT